MSYIRDFSVSANMISELNDWQYGINWPVVYIYYNDKRAYVGETLDAVRRVEQHSAEKQFDEFTKVCFITNITFNKSVILDLESFLIRYMSADGGRKLINGNAGVCNHNYFYKEAYEDDFKEIWNMLKSRGIVSKTIFDIENSELFKYSPYKSLNSEQRNAACEILHKIYKMNNASKESLIEVVGGAGTGKTILAVYVIKLLVDISRQRNTWQSVDDLEEANLIKNLAIKMSGINRIGFVVPMKELRHTMKTIFNSIDGLSSKMIYAPEEVTKEYFDILFVDEAHRLYQNKHLPQGAMSKFKTINMQLMGDEYHNDVNDLTELDWIIRSSRMQVLFYDNRQSIRTPDISKERFEAICKPYLYKYIELYSQMRCKGGNGYYEYVRDILEGSKTRAVKHKEIRDYTVDVVDNISELVEFIDYQNEHGDGLCKVVAGPGWSINEDIVIEDTTYHWAGSGLENDKIFSIHKTQGFDLNYAGVIFGKEVYFDKESGSIQINRKELRDSHTKSSGEDSMRQYVLNIYLTLLTRGINGTVIYAMDNNLREYLRQYFG